MPPHCSLPYGISLHRHYTDHANEVWGQFIDIEDDEAILGFSDGDDDDDTDHQSFMDFLDGLGGDDDDDNDSVYTHEDMVYLEYGLGTAANPIVIDGDSDSEYEHEDVLSSDDERESDNETDDSLYLD